ncbi:MAG TPA: glycosyltransferase family 39 protein [Hyphomicrobium sp.]|jgi:4-amino-4-deoxy-L-arabinose transferase-like glycosyltransferase
MRLFPLQLERLECPCRCAIDRIAARPRLAGAVLWGLALLCYLPGTLALPPVDRTEVVYAEMSRAMLARGDSLDATFQGERYPFRPIGITWLQMAAGSLLGKSAQSAIATYRLPSLIGGILAVLALWWLLRPLIGNRGALISAALFAVSPIIALQAQLAIPEGPLLLAMVVAQVSLLRLYCAPAPKHEQGLALLFWAAQGSSILLNALAVPILSLATLIALFVLDRDFKWLKRLRPLVGVPLMLLIAAPWLLVRAHVDGVPFSTLTFSELLRALGGAQDMKWKAAPLTFTLAMALGFLPGALLIVPALKGLWENRAFALQRFLLAWIVGYLLYLELIASKPALYTVQALFPALAAAVALALDRPAAQAASDSGQLAIPPLSLRLPWWLVLPATIALFAGGLTFAGVAPSFIVVGGATLVAVLFTCAARAMGEGRAATWVTTSIVGFALFNAYTFAVALPHIKIAWPAARIAEAVAPLQRCVVGPVGVLGFREPSSIFLLGPRSITDAETIAAWIATGEEAVVAIEDRFQPDVARVLGLRRAKLPPRLGCVTAFNVMRGCPLSFSIYVTGAPKLDPGCKLESRFACQGPPSQTPADATSRCR